MAIDKILGNGDLDKVADSVFSAVNDSVSEIKAMQKRKAAENVQIVVQALKKIEADLRGEYGDVADKLAERIASIKDGQNGRNGADGRNGKDGRPGRDGSQGAKGNDGLPGRDGVDGTDGVSVTNAFIDFDGSLIIDLSNGQSLNVGEVVAPDLAEKIKVINTMSTNSAVVINDEGVTISPGVKSLNFVGATVTATASGDDVTVNVSAGTGSVTSVNVTGGTTGLTTTGGPVTTSGTIALGGTLAPSNGGTGLTSLGAGVATFLATPSSANLRTAVTDETGTGALVFANSPTLVTPALGTPASGVVTNLTGTASININGTVGATTASTGAFTNLAYTGTLTGGTGVVNLGSGQVVKLSNGNVGIGGSPGVRLDVIGGTPSSAVAQFTGANKGRGLKISTALLNNVNDAGVILDAQQASGVLMLATGGTERLRITSTGNVGIGTSSPVYDLQVGSYGVDANSSLALASTTTGTGTIRFGDGTAGVDANAGQIQYAHTGNAMTFSTVATERMRITSAGNVGIGTSSPGSTLEISKANGGDILITNPTNYGTTPGTNPASRVSNGIVWLGNNTTGFGSIANIGTTNFIRSVLENFTTGNSAAQGRYGLSFGTAAGGSSAAQATERLRINSDGNVGIGTSSPVVRLQAETSGAGNGTVARFLRANGAENHAIQFNLDPDAKVSEIRAFGSTNGALSFATNNAERVRITSAGNVGIGTTAPDSALDVRGSGDLRLRPSADNSSGKLFFNATATAGNSYRSEVSMPATGGLTFSTTGTLNAAPAERMRITAAGNVGIGTSAPDDKLHVVGNARIESTTSKATLNFEPSVGNLQRLDCVATTSVSTIATNIFDAGRGGLVAVYGEDDSVNITRFIDLVMYIPFQNTVVVVSSVERGSPASRTYSVSSNNLQLAMSADTYKVRAMGFTFSG